MEENENIWSCGHPHTMILLEATPTQMSKYLRWNENNPENICYKCWCEKEGK